MSRSQFGQGKKPLDIFFWVNEITGEITYPPQNPDTPAAAEKQERTVAQHWGTQAAVQRPLGPATAQRPAPPPTLDAPLKDPDSTNFLRSPPAFSQTKAGTRSPPPFAAIPVTISPPGGALPAQGPLGPAPLPLPGTCNPCHHVTPRGDSASPPPPWTNSSAPTGQISPSPSPTLAFTGKLKKCPYWE
ncbi:uncharacterized protein C3orf86-like [Marmota marmota marmota]|uniref:uncharacterized protein C3orf86-like n=1 Tax=Marmota marmota marmota TaxID=9994 RepID=UPI0020924A3E|nr:uncharacterized protein C3orf86-like [Marmota marmota marmota]